MIEFQSFEGAARNFLPNFPRRLPEDLKGCPHRRFELGWLRRIPFVELLQQAEQASAQAAGAMRPDRIGGDALESVEEHLN